MVSGPRHSVRLLLVACLLLVADCGDSPASGPDPGGAAQTSPAHPPGPRNEEKAQAAVQRGQQQFAARRIEDAVKSFEEASAADPWSADAFAWLGRARVVASMETSYSRAIEAYRRALELDENRDEAYWGIGLAHFKMAEYKLALENFERFLARAPAGTGPGMQAEAHHFRGTILLFDGQAEQAIEALQTAARLNPDFPDTPWQIGLAREELGDNDQAIASLLKAITIDPDHIPSHFRLSRLYRKVGDRELAERHQRIHKLLTDLTDNISQRAQRDTASRLRLLTELTTLCPENFRARLRHAELMAQVGRGPEASLILDALLRDHTELAPAYLLRARLALQMQDPVTARQTLARLLKHFPAISLDRIPPPLRAYLPTP